MTASLALLRVHVLVVELPGRPVLRLRAEAAVRARGWVPVAEPADADLVIVCGTPVPSIVAAVDALWRRVPAPRVRRMVRSAEALPEALDSAARVLADAALQRRAAADPRPRGSAETRRHAASEVPGAASRGVSADPRTITFGPVGADWPAGLVLDCSLGADGRITAAGTRRVRRSTVIETAPELEALLAVADAARLLRLAGWEAPALRLDRVVDLALAGTALDRLRPRLRSVARLVRRSASFRWAAGPAVVKRLLALLGAAIDGTPAPAPSRRELVGARPGAVPMLVAATEPLDG